MNETTLKKTKNYFRAIGTVSELSLDRKEVDIKLKDEHGDDAGKMKGECIRGRVSLKTEQGVQTFDVYFSSHDNKGEEAKKWKMAESMLTWNPEIGGDATQPATLVAIEGSVDINDYVGQDGKVKNGIRWAVNKATTKVSADEATGCSLNGVFFIKGIAPETKGEEGEETGRLVVDLLAVKSNGKVFPIKTFVEKELASDFEGGYEVGQTAPFDIDVITRHVGGKASAKKTFGKASSVAVSSGFDVTELIIVGGEDVIAEPEVEDDEGNIIDNGYLNPKAIKIALKERADMLKELEANPPKKATPTKGSEFAEKKKVLGAKTKAPVKEDNTDFGDESDDDMPF